ncbi:MAG: hypothetical protein JSU73_13245 [candidate division WOR-3 bacterium]|nr:MAG: hypothetical protein JSU73_13245 [candidate division WOR-3 bacterium]
MALTIREKQAVTKELARRHARADRRSKAAIITQTIGLTGCNRSSAAWLLRTCGRPVSLPAARGQVVVCEADSNRGTRRRARPGVYDEQVFAALRRVWQIEDCICGKRLAPFLGEPVPVLERHEELVLDTETRAKLLAIGPATIDRLLSEEKRQQRLIDPARPKPNRLLLRQIPIVTHAERRSGYCSRKSKDRRYQSACPELDKADAWS